MSEPTYGISNQPDANRIHILKGVRTVRNNFNPPWEVATWLCGQKAGGPSSEFELFQAHNEVRNADLRNYHYCPVCTQMYLDSIIKRCTLKYDTSQLPAGLPPGTYDVTVIDNLSAMHGLGLQQLALQLVTKGGEQMDMREYLHRSIEKAERKLEMLDRFERLEDAPEGTVITFKKMFHNDPNRVFTYAGVKNSDGWHLTGSGRFPEKFTWEGLVRFLSDGVDEVWEATEWEEV